MADRQYPPLAEPFPDADTPLPTLPWLEASVRGRPPLPSEAFALPVVALPYDFPLGTPPDRLAPRGRVWGEGSPEFGRADAVAAPDLIPLALADPPRRRSLTPSDLTPVVVVEPQPLPGALTTTVVEGTLPCAIIPSGMTPGDDVDG